MNEWIIGAIPVWHKSVARVRACDNGPLSILCRGDGDR
jgi:hypothetical protein